MKNKKKVVSIILFIIIILLIYLVVASSKVKNVKVSYINDINEAYSLKGCLDKYFAYCQNYHDYNIKNIYDLIDSKEIEEYKLNIENFKFNIDVLSGDKIQIIEALKINQIKNVTLYRVKFNVLSKDSQDLNCKELLIRIDYDKHVFSVLSNHYVNEKKYNNLKIGSIAINSAFSDIKENDNNKFDTIDNKLVSENVEDIFDEFNENCMYYRKQAYDQLDTSFKNENYPKYEDFDSYIKSNIRQIVISELYSYDESKKDDYIEYKCKDSKGRVYNFKVYSYVAFIVEIEN